jgi:hypothetical protein
MSNLASNAEHESLVKSLLDQFIIDGLKILNADYEGYDMPYKVGRHEPDIIAMNPATEVVSIGEAKLCTDLTSERTREQFEDFSNRQMAIGVAKNEPVPFHILTPLSCAHKVWTVLYQSGLDKRGNIIVWQPRPGGVDPIPAYSNVSIKRIDVKSVSPDGIVQVAVHLDGSVDGNFIHWFTDPTPHSSVSSFDTRACTVTLDSIRFSVAQGLLKSAISLIREWVPIANTYAQAKYEELRGEKVKDKTLHEKLEKRRRELQDEVDKL